MKVVFMDLEMKPVAKEYRAQRALCQQEVIQFGAVKLENRREIASYACIVKPAFGNIPAYIEDLTGVTNAMTVGAADFATALRGFVEFCADADVIYAWSGTDLKQLQAELVQKQLYLPLQLLESRWMDYQRFFTDQLGLDRAISLEKAMDIALLPMDGHQHDALWDARNTAALYQAEEDLAVSARLRRVSANINCAPTTYSLAGVFQKCAGLF